MISLIALVVVGGVVAGVIAIVNASSGGSTGTRPYVAPQAGAGGAGFCVSCGVALSATDAFCGSCGTPRAAGPTPGTPVAGQPGAAPAAASGPGKSPLPPVADDAGNRLVIRDDVEAPHRLACIGAGAGAALVAWFVVSFVLDDGFYPVGAIAVTLIGGLLLTGLTGPRAPDGLRPTSVQVAAAIGAGAGLVAAVIPLFGLVLLVASIVLAIVFSIPPSTDSVSAGAAPAPAGATPPPPAVQGYAPAYAHLGTNGFATASLVLGILGISLLGLIFGLVALSQIKQTGGRQAGRGMAIAGVVLSLVWMAISITLIVVLTVAASNDPYY